MVAAAVITDTIAYFSDTETSVGNTFTAGTIDIAIDGQNPWTGHYDIPDLKPCETGYLTFNIQNKGANPVNASKRIYGFIESTGTESEPECSDQGGVWDNNYNACDWDGSGTMYYDLNDIQTQIIYDLSVEVYADDNATDPLWWQTIYSQDDNKSLTTIYGNNGQNSVKLGMIPVGGHMIVTQSYHFSCDAGNKYQGDKLTFNMEVRGDQLQQNNGATVTLENKNTTSGNWEILNDSIQGLLTYQTKGSKFDYDFSANGLTESSYQLIYYPDPWTSSKAVVLIGSPITPVSNSIGIIDASVELNMDLPVSTDANYPFGAKIWLVPTSSLSGTTLSWANTDKFLFDTALITYEDTDL